LWQDINHNGTSEAAELFSLHFSGLETIELDYKLSKATDEYGNRFRYGAKVKDEQDGRVSRWAWDVFLVKTRHNGCNATIDPALPRSVLCDLSRVTEVDKTRT
jgi:hypothetical protein